MTSDLRLAANRRNALKSTGPRSAHGKAVSRTNAMKSGIYAESTAVLTERFEDLDALTADYYRDHDPRTSQERFHVDTMIRCEWQTRRLALTESQLWQHADSGGENFGAIYHRADLSFNRLWRQLSSLQRAYRQAAAELAALQSAPEPDDETKPISLPAPRPPAETNPIAGPHPVAETKPISDSAPPPAAIDDTRFIAIHPRSSAANPPAPAGTNPISATPQNAGTNPIPPDPVRNRYRPAGAPPAESFTPAKPGFVPYYYRDGRIILHDGFPISPEPTEKP